MSLLAFLPWLRVEKWIGLGSYTLVPYRRGRSPGGAVQSICDALLAPYLSGTHPITHATLLKVEGYGLTDDLPIEEQRDAFGFGALLAVAGLSARQFFSPLGYVNRDNFTLILQSFTDPNRGVSTTTRRRDGSTNTYVTASVYRIPRPHHVMIGGPTPIDVPLLSALLDASSLSEWYLFDEAIFFFNQANTDSDQVPMESELMGLVSALERLLDCGRGREEEFVQRFLTSWKATRSVLPICYQDRINPAAQPASLVESWLRDLYRSRSELGHGKRTSGRTQYWTIDEHLLLASHVFPLVLKLRLAEHRAYTLGEADQMETDLFEALAGGRLFEPVKNANGDVWLWNRIRGEEALRRFWGRAAARV